MFYNKNLFQISLLLLWSECSSCVGTHFQDWYSNAWSEDFERSMPLTRHLEMDNCWSNPAPAWSGVPKQVLCKKLLLRRFGRGNISQWWSEGLQDARLWGRAPGLLDKGLFPNDVSANTTYLVVHLMMPGDVAWYMVPLKMMRDYFCHKTTNCHTLHFILARKMKSLINIWSIIEHFCSKLKEFL